MKLAVRHFASPQRHLFNLLFNAFWQLALSNSSSTFDKQLAVVTANCLAVHLAARQGALQHKCLKTWMLQGHCLEHYTTPEQILRLTSSPGPWQGWQAGRLAGIWMKQKHDFKTHQQFFPRETDHDCPGSLVGQLFF